MGRGKQLVFSWKVDTLCVLIHMQDITVAPEGLCRVHLNCLSVCVSHCKATWAPWSPTSSHPPVGDLLAPSRFLENLAAFPSIIVTGVVVKKKEHGQNFCWSSMCVFSTVQTASVFKSSLDFKVFSNRAFCALHSFDLCRCAKSFCHPSALPHLFAFTAVCLVTPAVYFLATSCCTHRLLLDHV